MLEALNVIIWAGFIYILFIFIRGMNDTQVQKHKEQLEENERKQKEKQILEESKEDD